MFQLRVFVGIQHTRRADCCRCDSKPCACSPCRRRGAGQALRGARGTRSASPGGAPLRVRGGVICRLRAALVRIKLVSCVKMVGGQSAACSC